MDESDYRQFAEEIFAESSTAQHLVVCSELLRNKHSPSNYVRRLTRIDLRINELLQSGNIDGARKYVTSLEWTGPPARWWCDTPEELAIVLQRIYTVLRQQRKSDAYDIGSFSPEVASIHIWAD